jgi:hypothetical protein
MLDTIKSVGDAKGENPASTDLIDYCLKSDGTKQLVTSNFVSSSMSVYNITNNDTRLEWVNTIENSVLGHCHGICYHPSNKDIVFVGTSGTSNPRCGAYALNLTKPDQPPSFGIVEKGWLCKDICFMNDINMFGLYCNSAPNPTEKRNYSTKVILYSIDLEKCRYGKISEVVIKEHHSDCIKYYNNKIYITVINASSDSYGEILVLNVNPKTGEMGYECTMDGYFFPHGLDINYGMFAVSEYGNSDVVIQKESDLQLE